MDATAEREFREFVAVRSAALLRTAYLLTGQREAAEDLLQTSLAKAANRWSRLEQPEAYVRKVMYHQQVNRWRLRSWGREQSTDAVPEIAGPQDDAELRLSLAAALHRLAARQRAVLVLRYLDGLPEKRWPTCSASRSAPSAAPPIGPWPDSARCARISRRTRISRRHSNERRHRTPTP